MISPATITRLRDAVDLQALAADYVKLQKVSAGDFVCKCPKHTEKTASCRIHKDRFYCFGCGWKGSAIDWVMQLEGIGFSAACKVLSERTGIALDSKPVSRVAMQYAREEAELCRWWWLRYRARLRAELDAMMAEDDPLQEHQWRWLTWDPGPARAFAFFREQVTAYDRWLWRADQAWDKRLERAWVECHS